MGWNGSVNGTRKDSQRNTSIQRENRVITLNSQQKNYRLFCVLSRVRESESTCMKILHLTLRCCAGKSIKW